MVGADSVVINTLVVGGKVETVIKQIIYVHNFYNVQYKCIFISSLQR